MVRLVVSQVVLLDRESTLPDELGCTARGKKADVLLDQTLGQVEQTGLVVDREDGYVRVSVGFGKTRVP